MELREQAIKYRDFVLECMEDAIRAAGSAGIPSGPFYMMLQTNLPKVFRSLDDYHYMLGLLVEQGRVTNEHHVLRVVKL